ncbi:hypothetical protein ACQZV8_10105 [Magnetococcales bacterium HHB-1]
MKSPIYMDGIGEIGFQGGMVRMNLVNLSATQKDEQGNPTLESNQQVVTSLRGFLISLNSMQEMADKLLEAGVLKKREEEA